MNCKELWGVKPIEPQWCSGCGNFGVLKVFREALIELDIQPKDVLVVGGIGCAGQMPQYLPCNSLKMPHGRVLPTAITASIANPQLTVLAQGGDGDAFAIGGAHFINAPGWNANIIYAVSNNEVYALTRGQFSPTAIPNLKTKIRPSGPIKNKMNPIAIALGAKWTFVARVAVVGTTKSGLNTNELTLRVLKKAIRHNGAGLIIFDTPCPTYNRLKTFEWLRERAVAIETLTEYYPNGYDPTDALAAYRIATQIFDIDKIPLGIYYDVEKPTLIKKLDFVRSLIDVEANTKELKKIMQEYK